MADAIVAANLPPGMDAYAGYVDGQWPDFPLIHGRYPGIPTLALTVYLANEAEGLDIEQGDATPQDAPTFVTERTIAKVWRPVLYCSQSLLTTVQSFCTGAGLLRSAYRLLSAHYGWGGQLPGLAKGQHICGPRTCGSHVQADGTQWIDHGGWDESLLADDFFASAPAPIPAPSPTTFGPIEETEMNIQQATLQVSITSGHGWVASPFPQLIGQPICVDRDPATVGTYPKVPVCAGVTAPEPGFPNGKLVFGPGGDGPASNGNYGFLVSGVAAGG